MSPMPTLSWLVALLVAILSHLAIAAIPVGSFWMETANDAKKPLEIAFSRHAPPSAPEPPSSMRTREKRREESLSIAPPPATERTNEDKARRPAQRLAGHQPPDRIEANNEAAREQEAPGPSREKSILAPEEAGQEPSYVALEQRARSESSIGNDGEQQKEEGFVKSTTSTAARYSRQSQPSGPPNMEGYGRLLSRAIQEEQRYPMAARRMRLEGEVHLRVRVLAGGALDGPPDVSLSSGVQSLDREAVRMVQSAAPFPPLPDGFSEKSAEFPVPVRFELR